MSQQFPKSFHIAKYEKKSWRSPFDLTSFWEKKLSLNSCEFEISYDLELVATPCRNVRDLKIVKLLCICKKMSSRHPKTQSNFQCLGLHIWVLSCKWTPQGLKHGKIDNCCSAVVLLLMSTSLGILAVMSLGWMRWDCIGVKMQINGHRKKGNWNSHKHQNLCQENWTNEVSYLDSKSYLKISSVPNFAGKTSSFFPWPYLNEGSHKKCSSNCSSIIQFSVEKKAINERILFGGLRDPLWPK